MKNMIKDFLERLSALSKETGIYLVGRLHYADVADGKHTVKEGDAAYAHTDYIPNYDGLGNGRRGDIIVCDGVERIPEKPVEFTRGRAPMGVSDIAPYISATGEHIGGRRQHREFLKDNNLTEVGNEKTAFEKQVAAERAPDRITPAEVAQAMEQASERRH